MHKQTLFLYVKLTSYLYFTITETTNYKMYGAGRKHHHEYLIMNFEIIWCSNVGRLTALCKINNASLKNTAFHYEVKHYNTIKIALKKHTTFLFPYFNICVTIDFLRLLNLLRSTCLAQDDGANCVK